MGDILNVETPAVRLLWRSVRPLSANLQRRYRTRLGDMRGGGRTAERRLRRNIFRNWMINPKTEGDFRY